MGDVVTTIQFHHVKRIVVGPVVHHAGDPRAGRAEFWCRHLVFEFEPPHDGAPKRFDVPLFSDTADGLRMPWEPEPGFAVRIAGPHASDLADLEVPPLDDADVFPAAAALPTVDATATVKARA